MTQWKTVPVEQTPEMDSETKTMKLLAFIDELAEVDPDRAIRFIESALAKNALRKRLAEKKTAAPQPSAEPVMLPSAVRSAAYDQIDRFLRNNLHDDDYADYSEALEIIYTHAPDDTALLRQALEAFTATSSTHGSPDAVFELIDSVIAALRERLGETK